MALDSLVTPSQNVLPLSIKVVFFAFFIFTITIYLSNLIAVRPTGHSRSIVGLEQKKNGSLCLLLLDPGSSVSETRKLLSGETVSAAVRRIRKFPGSLKHKQYQVVVVQGILSAADKQVSCFGKKKNSFNCFRMTHDPLVLTVQGAAL